MEREIEDVLRERFVHDRIEPVKAGTRGADVLQTVHQRGQMSGKILWEFPTISGVAAVPVSFQVDGRQYIAVQSGWGVDPAKMQARMNLLFPGKYPEVPQGGAVYVFALK